MKPIIKNLYQKEKIQDKNKDKVQPEWEEKNTEAAEWKRRFLILALLFACGVTGVLSRMVNGSIREAAQHELAEDILRIHIVANSDSRQDQELKGQVKQTVLNYLEENMPEDMEADGTKQWIKNHKKEIELCADNAIEEAGFSYPVSAGVVTCWYPEKTIGELTFPAGNYKSFRVEIGNAAGHNWWSILYPNLCFMDAVQEIDEENEELKTEQILTDEETTWMADSKKIRVRWYWNK